MLSRDPDAVIRPKAGKVMKVWVLMIEHRNLKHIPYMDHAIIPTAYPTIYLIVAEADYAVDTT